MPPGMKKMSDKCRHRKRRNSHPFISVGPIVIPALVRLSSGLEEKTKISTGTVRCEVTAPAATKVRCYENLDDEGIDRDGILKVDPLFKRAVSTENSRTTHLRKIINRAT